jgi:hypothetical protein
MSVLRNKQTEQSSHLHTEGSGREVQVKLGRFRGNGQTRKLLAEEIQPCN